MKPLQRVVRGAIRLLHVAVAAAFTLMFVVGAYALWDSKTLEDKASATYWQPYKPVEPEALSFHELQDINPDVVAWLTVYGTNIDYPVCHSTDINKYLTYNAEGKASASGALFMDPEDPRDFSDFSNLVYGHHMEHGVMFGQIADFQAADTFDTYRYGNLYANGRSWGIQLFCTLKADAYDRQVYKRGLLSEAEDQQKYIDLLRDRAIRWRDVGVAPGDRLIIMSTCSTASTNGRDLLVGRITDQTYENAFAEWPNLGTGVDEVPSFMGIPWYGWAFLGALVVLILVFAIISLVKRRRGGPSKESEP